jgi:hypothetical protein
VCPVVPWGRVGGHPGWFIALCFSLLAPLSLSAQDRSTVRVSATVLPAHPSRGALGAALHLATGQPVLLDSARALQPRLAEVRVRRPVTPADSAVVVSIEFLRN